MLNKPKIQLVLLKGMKKIFMLAVLAGCATLVMAVNTPPPPVPGQAPPTRVARKILMSPKAQGGVTKVLVAPELVTQTAAPTSPTPPPAAPKVQVVPGLVRDSHIMGYQPEYGFWNGTGFDVPVDPAWVQIFVPNPTRSSFIKVDWSPDLKQWLTIGYFTNFTQGVLMVDPSAVGVSKRFYRVQALTP